MVAGFQLLRLTLFWACFIFAFLPKAGSGFLKVLLGPQKDSCGLDGGDTGGPVGVGLSAQNMPGEESGLSHVPDEPSSLVTYRDCHCWVWRADGWDMVE